MKEIQLTQGKVALVSDDKFENLSRYKWTAQYSPTADTWYAVRDSDHQRIFIHRVILGLEFGDSRRVDHKDHNGLNNQNENVRVATASQNRMNSKKIGGTSSKYKGVTGPRWGSWIAQIRKDYKYIHLGSFSTEEEAARAYDKAAKEMFGEFAHLNFPHEMEVM